MSESALGQQAHPDYWRRCSSCKKHIGYSADYYVCNVSTCNRKRTGLVFCDVSCWDAHVPGMNHRESWAEDRKSPTHEEWKRILSGEVEKPKRAPRATPAEAPPVVASTAPKVLLRKKT